MANQFSTDLMEFTAKGADAITRGFEARTDQANSLQRQRVAADLSLRNQTLINQQQEEEQIRAERRELAEIQRQKAEWSFGDKTTDFLIKAGDYPRINEKMAQDSQFANEFATIMKDESTDWGQKVRAIYAAEAAASRRIAIKQKAIPFADTLKANQATITLPSGEQINVIRDPETRKLYTTHLKRDENDTSPWESEPQGQTQEQPQQEEMAEMYPGGPLIPRQTPYPGAPVPVAPKQPLRQLPRWKPGAQMAMALKIMGESKASGVPITLPDAQIMAEAERYKEASIPFTKEFATMYDAAYNRQQRAWEASIAKMAGTNKPPEPPKPGPYDTDAGIEKVKANLYKAMETDDQAFLKSKPVTDIRGDGYYKDDLWQTDDGDIKPLSEEEWGILLAHEVAKEKERLEKAKAFNRPTATPGMTPTPRATPGPASPGGEDERRARAKARNDELKAMNISAEVRRTILLQEGLIDQ